jgi:hypothetical protein
MQDESTIYRLVKVPLKGGTVQTFGTNPKVCAGRN